MNFSEHEQRWARGEKVAFSRDSQPAWVDLDEYIVWLKSVTPDRQLWKDIIKNPLTPTSLIKLTKTGWCVKSWGPISDACCDLQKKEIQLGDFFGNGYQRDEGLFHEIYHAWYGKQTSDNTSMGIYLEERENNAIGHWLARQWRANPELLRQAINCFDLESRIYDRVSFIAHQYYNPGFIIEHYTPDFTLQLAFPFGEEIRQNIQQTLF